MNNGLKPCGYCGGEARFELSFLYPGPRVTTRCTKCGHEKGPYVFHQQDVNFRIHRPGDEPTCSHAIKRAREDWNRRQP